MKAGKTTVIVPTGGTEKNGYHMVIGKHNYVVAYAANLMARRLKNALVAPTLQYVPEGDPDRQNAGRDLGAVAGVRHDPRRRGAQPARCTASPTSCSSATAAEPGRA